MWSLENDEVRTKGSNLLNTPGLHFINIELSIFDGLWYTLDMWDTIACPNPKKKLDGFRSAKNKYKEYVKVLFESRF